jgi:2-polyprenyl-3-methyl-5-hydroxy-6-metoxy-1,4-benzoquinol methylase
MDKTEAEAQYTYNDYATSPDPPHQPLYLKKVLRHLAADPSIVHVLDAGCGDGNFAASLQDAGFEMFGLDMSPSGVKIANARGAGSFVVASVYDDLLSPFSGIRGFDAIVAVEVVEHLYAPRLFARRALAALRPGGRLVVTSPYWGYFKNIAVAVSGHMDRNLTALWDGGHIKHWSRKTLTQLMLEQTFEVVAFEGAGRRPPYLWRGMVMVFRKPLEHN